MQDFSVVNFLTTKFGYYVSMNFNTRLKEEIEYVGIQYKELAAKADVKLRALFTYVGSKPSMPPADVAVRIARALDVTVEYLVDGNSSKSAENLEMHSNLSQKQRKLFQTFENLSPVEQKAVLNLMETLLEQK